jgi:hypothetical protein
MPMTRSGLSSLMGYQEGGNVSEFQQMLNAAPAGSIDLADIPDANKSLADQYIETVGSIKETPFSVSDIRAKAKEYEGLFPQTQPQSFYDLAGALAKGIFASQSEKFPTLGRGLGYGFEIFNEANKKRDVARQKMSDTLMTMAVASSEKIKARDYELRSKLAEMEFENLMKAQIAGSKLFSGKSPFEQAANFLMTNKNNPKIIASPEYAIMYELVTKPNTQIVQTESGALPVTTPGMNLEGVVPAPTGKNKVQLKIGDPFPDPKYSSYILQADGKTFMSNGKSYTYNQVTGIMEPR